MTDKMDGSTNEMKDIIDRNTNLIKTEMKNCRKEVEKSATELSKSMDRKLEEHQTKIILAFKEGF